jgi:hypothetical protein
MKPSVFVLEGLWDKPLEAPQVLPYLTAYEQTYRQVNVFHRTFRNQEDLAFYIGRIPRNQRSFVYIACHAEIGMLDPSDRDSRISAANVQKALAQAKDKSIGFLHFGCCEFVQAEDASRRQTLDSLMQASGARWVSGYAKTADWLSSMLIDLALISEVYAPWHRAPAKKASAHSSATNFLSNYEQLARAHGFSALSCLSKSPTLFPKRLT